MPLRSHCLRGQAGEKLHLTTLRCWLWMVTALCYTTAPTQSLPLEDQYLKSIINNLSLDSNYNSTGQILNLVCLLQGRVDTFYTGVSQLRH